MIWRLKKKKYPKNPWHKWFAWYPIKFEDDEDHYKPTIVWMQYVMRRFEVMEGHHGQYTYYKILREGDETENRACHLCKGLEGTFADSLIIRNNKRFTPLQHLWKINLSEMHE